jgi:hypothetical protein
MKYVAENLTWKAQVQAQAHQAQQQEIEQIKSAQETLT